MHMPSADICSAVHTGKCVSGSFVVLDKPLLPFSKAAAACAKAGKKLATIDKIFGGTSTSCHHLCNHCSYVNVRACGSFP